MTRYGIGPKFFAATVLYGLPAGWLTYRYPDLFSIQCIPYWGLLCLAVGLLVVGATIYAKALRAFRDGYSKGHLVTQGIFSVVRHPIYAAWIWLIIPGFVLFFRSWLLLAVPFVAYAAFKVFIREEDECLQQRFGETYAQYRSRVNELFPSWKRPNRLGLLMKNKGSRGDCP
ncbi:methyltransferase family protein [Verrucomicrobiota bacterium]